MVNRHLQYLRFLQFSRALKWGEEGGGGGGGGKEIKTLQ